MAKSVKKNPSAKPSEKQTKSDIRGEGENIDKIRDILFGAQTRQFDKQLSVLESKLDKAIESLRGETKATIDTVEQFVRKELKRLSDQLVSEKSDRDDAVDHLSDKLSDARKALDKKIGQLGDKAVKDQRETQEQILKQSKTLMEEMNQKTEVLQSRFDRAVEELSEEKTDRQYLANLLLEVGMRLKDEFQLPETD